jgi:hypothetical protein
MELINVASAKAIWLINATDMNPKGLRILPQLTDALVENYDFDDTPDPQPGQNGIKLKEGMFDKEGQVYRVGLEIYDDGFVAESAHSTDLTEAFMLHALEWAKVNFPIRFEPHFVWRKMYYSEIVVRFSSPLAAACSALAEFSQVLSQSPAAPGTDGYMLTALTFSARTPPAGANPKTVVIERRVNSGPDANMFYCKAPVKTDEFIKLLENFDDLLSGSKAPIQGTH